MVQAPACLDHYFNVRLGISRREMELTRTCCFEFDRMRRADSKHVLFSTFCFYFRLARFTSLSPLPQVDNRNAPPRFCVGVLPRHPLSTGVVERNNRTWALTVCLYDISQHSGPLCPSV